MRRKSPVFPPVCQRARTPPASGERRSRAEPRSIITSPSAELMSRRCINLPPLLPAGNGAYRADRRGSHPPETRRWQDQIVVVSPTPTRGPRLTLILSTAASIFSCSTSRCMVLRLPPDDIPGPRGRRRQEGSAAPRRSDRQGWATPHPGYPRHRHRPGEGPGPPRPGPAPGLELLRVQKALFV